MYHPVQDGEWGRAWKLDKEILQERTKIYKSEDLRETKRKRFWTFLT